LPPWIAPGAEITTRPGRWHMYHNGIYGVDPTNKMIRANGELAQNGWSNIPEVETEVAAWYDAKTT
jgi:hypothetical protein